MLKFLASTKIKGRKRLEQTFVTAAYTRNLKQVLDCLNRGVDPNYRNVDGRTALHIAAERGDAVLALKVLDDPNSDIDVKTAHGYTALIIACMHNRVAFVRWILQKGADPNICDRMQRSPLHIGVRNRSPEIVMNLIKMGADINVVDVFGHTPLSFAIEGLNADVGLATMLVRKGAILNEMLPGENLHFLFDFVLGGNNETQLTLLTILVKLGLDINLVDDRTHRNCLHYVSIGGYFDMAKALVEYGANLYQTDTTGRTPLLVAKDHAHFKLCEFFYENMFGVSSVVADTNSEATSEDIETDLDDQ